MTTLRQLRFLVALSDTLSFSRAAEACHVTQSTLSAGLKELELDLGVQLAERTRQSVLMTPIGTEIAARARAVLADVAEIEVLAREEAGEGMRALRLGAIPTVGPFIMPHALPLIRKALPGTNIYLREDLTAPLLDQLADGRLDLVLMALPHEVPREIHTETLFQEGYQLATPRDHPLANRPAVEGADLAARKLLLLERGHCLQRHALSAFPDVPLTDDDSFAATSLATLIAMVEQGLGLTLLPNLAVAAGATRGSDIALTDLPGARSRDIVLAWRRTAARVDIFHTIGEAIVEARAKILAEARTHPVPRNKTAA